jgi:hypothetical protein
MNNIAAARKASRRKGCRRNRRMNQMGGAGEAYTLGGHVAGAPIVNNYGQEVVRFPSCENATRPGYIADASIKGGLPGFAGGGRRRRNRSRRNHSLKGGRGGVLETSADQLRMNSFTGSVGAPVLKGGRYTFEPNVVNGVGVMEARYSGCGDGAIQNPLNKGDVSSLITAPPAQVPTPTPGSMKGGRRGTRRSQYGGVGGVDSMVYNAPRAGWSVWPSNAQGGNAGVLADGQTPFSINVPFSAQPVVSQACIKTGGGRKTRHRKSRKGRKGRKGTRRH